jgi:ribosomal protein L11 methylase PrmA
VTFETALEFEGAGVTCGKLILSGILDTQLDMVQASLHENGIDDFEITQDGEWVALIV